MKCQQSPNATTEIETNMVKRGYTGLHLSVWLLKASHFIIFQLLLVKSTQEKVIRMLAYLVSHLRISLSNLFLVMYRLVIPLFKDSLFSLVSSYFFL